VPANAKEEQRSHPRDDDDARRFAALEERVAKDFVLLVGKIGPQVEVAGVSLNQCRYGFGRDRNPVKSVA
jgi:hypothetical protein